MVAVVVAVGTGVGLWLIGPLGDAPVDAAAAVEAGCEKVELSGSYDAFITVTYRGGGVDLAPTSLYEVRVNGDDYHMTAGFEGEEETVKFVRVDGASYEHNPQGEWVRMDDSGLSDLLPACGKLINITNQGKATLADGSKTTRYSAERPQQAGVHTDDYSETARHLFDYWIDDNGQFVQHKREIIVDTTIEGESSRMVVEHLYTFSGFGEENVITAPMVK